ncbi:MAG: AraC family transcriptional regulator, partial [Leeuwenhoekiella sp.]
MDNSTDFEKKREGFLGQQMIVLPPDSMKEIVKNLLIHNFFLTAIGFYPNARFHDRKREKGADEYILLYCTEGQGKISVENNKFKIKPNHFIIIPPNVAHHYKSSIKNPWTIYWIHFTGKRALTIYERYSYKKKPRVKFIPYNEIRVENFLEIIQLLEYSFENRSLELANIKLIYFLSSFVYRPELIPKNSENNLISNSIEFMKKNIHKPLKIEDLATNESLSVSRFSEVFKEKTGSPPIHYFNKIKIQKSCQYLYFTDMSIKEICILVGFSD